MGVYDEIAGRIFKMSKEEKADGISLSPHDFGELLRDPRLAFYTGEIPLLFMGCRIHSLPAAIRPDTPGEE